MGMPIIVDVRDEHIADGAIDEVFDWFRWVDATFSTFKPDSEICRLDRGELALDEAHPDVRAVLARCEELCEETGGYFDVRASASRQLDPSGLVKGWAVDRAAAILDAAGAANYAVNAGGDIRLRGGALPESTSGASASSIRSSATASPRSSRRVTSQLRPRAPTSAASTSSTRTRAGHRRGVLSVTITGPDLATADAYATTAFAMGHARRAMDGDARRIRGDDDPRRRARAAHAGLPGSRLRVGAPRGHTSKHRATDESTIHRQFFGPLPTDTLRK